MSSSRKEFIVDFFAHVDALDFEWMQENLTTDCRIEAPGFSETGGEIVALWMAGFFATFPDLKHRPHRILATDAEAALLVHVTGTHTEELGLPNGDVVPPTGRPLDITLAEFWQFTDGKVSEYRVVYDQADFLTQLGLLDLPA
ncbi:ester cyclase [Antrihabitans stalactiti]|uniref:Ester cyclase n=1 Tax=Antrihabitans stalactiti TaxID=2584121 RepID=A0A848KJD7_9NOCA|nr:ester cyclase [Antrihabitans stalactiti]NMN98389.1 ester cyclase [Antrihabitans stalactiti]